MRVCQCVIVMEECLCVYERVSRCECLWKCVLVNVRVGERECVHVDLCKCKGFECL